MPAMGTASLSLWIIISVIGGITLVAVGLVVAVLCYRKCGKKQKPSRQNVYVSRRVSFMYLKFCYLALCLLMITSYCDLLYHGS